VPSIRTRAILRALITAAVLAVAVPGVAAAATCPDDEPVSQPFLGLGDDFSYFIAPGGDFEAGDQPWATRGATWSFRSLNFTGHGERRGLALADGAAALSPAFCVDNSRPVMRLGARALEGGGQLTVTAVTPGGGAVQLGAVDARDHAAFTWTPQLSLAPELAIPDGESMAVRLQVRATGTWAFDAVSIDPYRH